MTFGEFTARLRNDAYLGLDAGTHKPDLKGWMDPHFEPAVAKMMREQNGRRLEALEVGGWKGLSTSAFGGALASRRDTSGLTTIDTWLGSPEFWTTGLEDPTRGAALRQIHGFPSVFYTFTSNMKALGLAKTVTPFPISADQGFDVLRYYKAVFDLIYLDASHEKRPVRQNIDDAWSVLRPGGLVFGDDFSQDWPGVMAAVLEFAGEHHLKAHFAGILWFLSKPFDDGSVYPWKKILAFPKAK
jgi:hypothetical protein